MESVGNVDPADWLGEPPADAAAAVAPPTLVELEAPPVVEAKTAELNKLSREEFPLPRPTAGTLPVSFPVPGEGPALANDALTVREDAIALA